MDVMREAVERGDLEAGSWRLRVARTSSRRRYAANLRALETAMPRPAVVASGLSGS
jgi:hypothetical protein